MNEGAITSCGLDEGKKRKGKATLPNLVYKKSRRGVSHREPQRISFGLSRSFLHLLLRSLRLLVEIITLVEGYASGDKARTTI